MSEQIPPVHSTDDSKVDSRSDSKKDSISVVYHQRNDSPKYFEISRTKVYLFFIGLPTLALIGFILGAIGLIHTSPFHLMENYRKTSKAREAYLDQEAAEEKLQSTLAENTELKNELASLQGQLKETEKTPVVAPTDSTPTTAPTGSPSPEANLKCPAPTVCPDTSSAAANINLSTLSLFKPIAAQKNRTRPAVLSLAGFKTLVARDTVSLQFNIIPTVEGDAKISGHIVVLMKNELGISAYPQQVLGGSDYQMNYSAGEPFATQRFRPVDASFLRPRKPGNYVFTIFIFSKTGDLLHYQTTILPLKL